MKLDGLEVESCQLETGNALKKLTLMALLVALKILQLKQERDGQSQIEAHVAFDTDEIDLAKQLMPQYEGKTEKLKNPYPPESLAWMSWLIGRLGGWKGYRSSGPPGVISLKRGLTFFDKMVMAYKTAIYKVVYKE